MSDDASPNAGEDPSVGYWYARRHEDFPPASIRNPEQYSGGERLSVYCTQTELPARQQKALVAQWCNVLPTLAGVRTLWLGARVPQALFDAACAMPSLQGLHLASNAVTSVESIRRAGRLRYLDLGRSPGIVDFSPILSHESLRWLQLSHAHHITALSSFAKLQKLEGFGFVGGDGKPKLVDSFSPLASMSSLHWLHIGALQAKDQSLRALSDLGALRWLGVGRFFSWQEFAWLAGRLPTTQCQWFEPTIQGFGSCKRCKQTVVMLSGVGLRDACPQCDRARLDDFIAGFEAVRLGARE